MQKPKIKKWCTWSDRVCCHLGGGGSVTISHDRWSLESLIAWAWPTNRENGTHVHALHIEFRLRIHRSDSRNFKYVNCPNRHLSTRCTSCKKKLEWRTKGDWRFRFFFAIAKRSEWMWIIAQCTREYETCCMINYIYFDSFQIPVHFLSSTRQQTSIGGAAFGYGLSWL